MKRLVNQKLSDFNFKGTLQFKLHLATALSTTTPDTKLKPHQYALVQPCVETKILLEIMHFCLSLSPKNNCIICKFAKN